MNLTVKEAAARLGLSVDTLNKWRSEGKGPPFVKFGRRVLYRAVDLDEWELQQVRRSTAQ